MQGYVAADPENEHASFPGTHFSWGSCPEAKLLLDLVPMEGISKPNSAEMKEQRFSRLAVTSGSDGKSQGTRSIGYSHSSRLYTLTHILTWLY